MNDKISDSKGFGVIELLIILVVISLLGFGGWYVYSKRTSSNDRSQTSGAAADKQTASHSVTSKTYTNDEYGFSFDYPGDWTLTANLSDTGLGHSEGDVIVVSPNGTKVHFGPNQGGKGGDCVDPEANSYTTKTCSTFTTYKAERLPSSLSEKPIYYHQASLTAPTNSGGKTKYYVFITNNEFFPTAPKTITGAFLQPYDEIDAKDGYVTVYVEGKDDAKNNSAAFFDTQEVSEAEPVLQSFRLL